MRSPLASLATAGLLLGGCTYDYQNAAEKLLLGEVTGRVVADLSGTGPLQGVGGVDVTLKNSMNGQLSRENGRFFLTGLVAGRHTLLFRKGTTWALQRDVELGFGSDGQLEGVVMGDLRLRYSVALGGTFTPPVAIDGFQPVPPTAVAVDEATGDEATVTPELDGFGDYTGRFTYAFPVAPVGSHRVRFGVTALSGGVAGTWVGGPLAQEIPDTSEGQSITLSPATLRVPDAVGPAKLRFRVAMAAGAPGVTLRVNTVPPTVEENPIPDSTGVVELDLTEGLYTVFVDLGATPGSFEAPAPLIAVAVANQTSELGTLYVTDFNATVAGSSACLSTPDCASPFACVSGTCKEPGLPSQPALCVTGTNIDSDCSLSMNGCVSTPPSTNTTCDTGKGVCGQAPSGTLVCIPNGAPDCTFSVYVVPRPFCG